MQVEFEAVGRHVNAAYRVCDGLGQNKIVRVGKNTGPVLSRLWTKVHDILRHVGDHSYFSTPLPVYVTFRSADIRHYH